MEVRVNTSGFMVFGLMYHLMADFDIGIQRYVLN